MGSCTTCVGPNRRAEKYRVNRLTEDSPMKSSITPSELPIRKHKDRVIEQLNQSKRRIDRGENNLINTLLSSGVNPQPRSGSPSKTNHKLSTSAYYNDERNEPLRRAGYDITTSMNFNSSRRLQPRYENQMLKYSDIGKVFDRNYVQSSRYGNQTKGPPILPQFKPVHSQTSLNSQIYRNQMLRSNKEPLSEIVSLKSNLNENYGLKHSEYSRRTKSYQLLNIPELPQEEAKTPQYVSYQRKQNGEDVLKSGLQGLPKKLEGAPSANLFRYLKDLQ